MSGSDVVAERVIDELRVIVEADNGRLEMMSFTDGVVWVKYVRGHNPNCDTCVMGPEDLGDYLTELFRERVPAVREVAIDATA
jgi:Fe-S cluster biogenesis protein NfuA